MVTAWSMAVACPVLPRRLKFALWIFWIVFWVAGISLIAGIAGLLHPWAISATSIFLALAFCLVINPAWSITERLQHYKAWLFKIATRHPFVCALGGTLFVFMLTRHVLYIWLLPPHVYDVLTYHLPKVADWIQAERLVALPTPVVRSYWPANMELIQTWFALFIHHDVLIELAGVPFWLLGGLSVYSIVRSLGLPAGPAFWAMLAYWSTPVILQNAVSGKNDIVIAAIYLFSIALALEWRNHTFWSWPILLPLFSGLCFAVGVKPTILFMGLPLLGFISFHAPWKISRIQPETNSIPVGVMVIVTIMALGLASYWYLRNAFLFGNPFHPTDFRLFGMLIAGDGHGTGQQGGFSIHSAMATIRSLWVERRLWDVRGPFSPDVTFMTGWGWFAFSVGIPSVVLAQSNRLFPGITALFFSSAFLLLCFVDFDPWNMRFLQWFPALFCIAFAVAQQHYANPGWRGAVLLLAISCMTLNLVGTMNNGWFCRDDWRRFMAMSWRDRAVYTGFENYWRSVPRGEKLGYFMSPNDPVYVLRGPGFQQVVEMLRVDSADRNFAAAMDRQNLSYLAYAAEDRDFEWRGPFNAQLEGGKFVTIRQGLYLRSHEKKDP